jgi:hypothetical protein
MRSGECAGWQPRNELVMPQQLGCANLSLVARPAAAPRRRRVHGSAIGRPTRSTALISSAARSVLLHLYRPRRWPSQHKPVRPAPMHSRPSLYHHQPSDHQCPHDPAPATPRPSIHAHEKSASTHPRKNPIELCRSNPHVPKAQPSPEAHQVNAFQPDAARVARVQPHVKALEKKGGGGGIRYRVARCGLVGGCGVARAECVDDRGGTARLGCAAVNSSTPHGAPFSPCFEARRQLSFVI